MKPDLAEARYSSGLAKSQLKDYQGAIVDYTKAIELMPEFAKAYYIRGATCLLIGQKTNAQSDFTRAIELGLRIPQKIVDECK